MADSPVDIITEVMSDLDFAMEAGADLDYQRTEDGKIEVREYDDDGNKSDVVGHLTFVAVK